MTWLRFPVKKNILNGYFSLKKNLKKEEKKEEESCKKSL